MRKILTVFMLLFVFIKPIHALASDKSYDIDRMIIYAQITEKGDIEVKESITYTFHGSFNGIYRNLSDNGASGHTISTVSIQDKSDKVMPLKLSSDSSDNTYQIIKSSGNSQLKIFSKSSDETKTFLIDYTILDAAVKYADSGELYWNFYSVENNAAVKDVELNLSLKNTDFNMDKFKYWSYVDGDFTTNYDAHGIQLKGSNLTSLLGLKVVFQPEFLENPLKFYKDKNYQDVGSSDEKNPAISDLSEYQGSKPDENGFPLFMFALIIAAAISIFIYTNSRKNRKFQAALEEYRAGYDFFKGESMEEPPMDISPAFVNLLYHEKRVTDCVIPATLFYLCQKGYFDIKKGSQTDWKIFKKREEETLSFIRDKGKPLPDTPHLKFLINWLSIYEEDGVLTLKSIEKRVRTSHGSMEFRNKYSSFEFTIKNDAEKQGFYTVIEGKTVLSNEANNEKLKWLAYRNYLQYAIGQDNGGSELKNADEALAYAAALEISTDSLMDFIKTLSSGYYDDSGNYGYGMFFPFFYANLVMWDNINADASANYDTGSSSGNDGGFGGFSGGGDFSGGGGGGSGAF